MAASFAPRSGDLEARGLDVRPHRRRKIKSRVVLMLLTAFLLGIGAIPVHAGSDTTPPQLVSFTITPDQIDVSSSSQTVTVSAVITDDLSGVSIESNVELYSPSTNQWTYGFFDHASGDTYTTTLVIPQYAENGIWRDWYFFLEDNATNQVVVDEYDLLLQGINVALGVGNFDDAYARTLSLRVGRTRASGHLNAQLESTCFWFVPVILQRRTAAGWREVGTALSSYQGDFSFRIRREGKYRAIAPSFGLGTPALTTCSQVSRTARS